MANRIDDVSTTPRTAGWMGVSPSDSLGRYSVPTYVGQRNTRYEGEGPREVPLSALGDFLAPLGAVAGIGGLLYATTIFAFGASPKTMAVGYAPDQPVRYSHALHAGKLGLDCRYCHNTVEKTAFASLPATQTCMNCHTKIWNTSELLKPVRDSWETGKPIQWIKIHNLANYVYFNHSAHINHGVGCIECHGRIDRMDVVFQAAPLSMGWCLECHRAPESHLRPKDVRITDMEWKHPEGEEGAALGEKLRRDYQIHDTAYMTSCYTCHR